MARGLGPRTRLWPWRCGPAARQEAPAPGAGPGPAPGPFGFHGKTARFPLESLLRFVSYGQAAAGERRIQRGRL